jgi:HlyD family secretion protein
MAVKLTKKHAWWAGAAAAAVVIAWLAFRPAVLDVETAVAARGALLVTLDEEGRTRVRDRYVVVAPVAGRVARIDVEPGDSVTSGAVVARVSPAPLDPRGREQAEAVVRAAEEARRAADAAVQQARAALQQARRNRERMAALAGQELMSPADLEQSFLAETTAVYGYAAAQARAAAAAHEVEQARAALLAAAGAAGPGATIALRSPVCGRILAVPERSERIVAAGAPLVEVGDCGRLEVVIDILTTDAVDVRPGARVLVEPWSGERPPLEARVRRVEPAAFTKVSALGVEEQRVNVIADFTSPALGLGDGFRVEAHLVLWEGRDVLKVPSSALFRAGAAWGVFVVDHGRARLRTVDVGRRNPSEAEIRGGLSAGEVVVRHPSDRVADGIKVQGR